MLKNINLSELVAILDSVLAHFERILEENEKHAKQKIKLALEVRELKCKTH